LAVVNAASLLRYVGDLGFYYDDYSVLRRMSLSEDQSLLGLYDAVRPATGQRPLQAFTFATLYRFFGTDALGYHIWNAFLLVAIAVLLYLVLRKLRLPRLICVAVSLLYSTLPTMRPTGSGWMHFRST
jgi:dolichyl-phosphate-mannose--protein O-mannosyl transferase